MVIALAAPLLPGCMTTGGWDEGLREGARGAWALVRTDDLRFGGELLLVRDEGVVLLWRRQAVLVGWTTLERLSLHDAPVERVEGGERPEPRHFEQLRMVSRYPYGLTDSQLWVLLRSLGQTSLEVVP